MRKNGKSHLSEELLEQVTGGVLNAGDSQLSTLFGVLKSAGTLGGRPVTELDGLLSYLDTDDFWDTYGSEIATDRDKDVPALKSKLKLLWNSL